MNTQTVRNMHILFYEYAVCRRDTKMEHVYLMMLERKMIIAMWFYRSMIRSGDRIATVKKTETKKVQNRFLYCHEPTSHQADMPILF